MKRLIWMGAILLSTGALANEKLHCVYTVIGMPEPEYLPMHIFGRTEVRFDGKSFTAFRQDGTYVVTPVLADRNGELYLDDITSVISVSRDRTNFGIFHRISQMIERWDQCQKVAE